MTDRVEVKVTQRVVHRREVTDLAGEVEDDIGVGNRIGNDVVADLCLHDLDLEALDIATIAAVRIDQGIDDANRSASGDEFVSEVGAYETQAACDHARGR